MKTMLFTSTIEHNEISGLYWEQSGIKDLVTSDINGSLNISWELAIHTAKDGIEKTEISINDISGNIKATIGLDKDGNELKPDFEFDVNFSQDLPHVNGHIFNLELERNLVEYGSLKITEVEINFLSKILRINFG